MNPEFTLADCLLRFTQCLELFSKNPFSFLADRMQCQQGKMAAFSNVLQCQRDALAKGVEIIKKTLDKYDILDNDEEES